MHIKYLVPIWQVYGYCIYLYIPLNIVTIYYYYFFVCDYVCTHMRAGALRDQKCWELEL